MKSNNYRRDKLSLNNFRGGDDLDFGLEPDNPLVPLNPKNGPKILFNKKELGE